MKRILLLLVVLLLVIGCAKEPTPETVTEEGQVESQPDEPAVGESGVQVGIEPKEEIEVEVTPETPALEEEIVVAVATNTVMINRKNLDPETIKVSVGATVTWKNLDDRKHLIVGKDFDMKSPNLMEGDTFSYTFEVAGTFNVVDALFGSRGVIEVE